MTKNFDQSKAWNWQRHSLQQKLKSVSDTANLLSADVDRDIKGYWIKKLISPRINHRNKMAHVQKNSRLGSESASDILLGKRSMEKEKLILNLGGSNLHSPQNSEKGKKHYYLSQIVFRLWERNSV